MEQDQTTGRGESVRPSLEPWNQECFQTGSISLPGESLPEPPPLNPGCHSSCDHTHTKCISQHFTKYKLWCRTLEIYVPARSLSVSHNHRVTLVARRPRLVFRRRLTSISRGCWEISQREENNGVCMPAPHTSINTGKCKWAAHRSGVIATDGDLVPQRTWMFASTWQEPDVRLSNYLFISLIKMSSSLKKWMSQSEWWWHGGGGGAWEMNSRPAFDRNQYGDKH